MNTIVREHYPVAGLPEDLRRGLPADAKVRVTIEQDVASPTNSVSISDLFAARRPPYLATEQIVDDIRSDREAWE